MKAPAYHLRPNKAVDRLVFMDAIRRLDRIGSLNRYTYFGLGGPFLEDFRALYEFAPDVGMVSLEEDPHVLRRQQFHRPCGSLKLKRTTLGDFLATFDPDDRECIFWLDYTRLEFSCFEEFMALLPKVVPGSVIKVTLRAEWKDYWDQDSETKKRSEFRSRFGALMPDATADPPVSSEPFVQLLQDMLQIAAQQALPASTGLYFQPLCSFYYTDGTFMLTLTGIVCRRTERRVVRTVFKDWRFASLDWARPKRIDVPVLTTKERQTLQGHLPLTSRPGPKLQKTLGYFVDDTRPKSTEKMRQYAQFHRYYPYFMRAVP